MKLKLISDGTCIGTKLIDEDTGEMVHGISKINCKMDAKDTLSTVTVEFFNIPVEIQALADVNITKYDNAKGDFTFSKTIKKLAKIVSELKGAIVSTHSAKVFDVDSGKTVGAVQNVSFEATTEKVEMIMEKLHFDKKDWV